MSLNEITTTKAEDPVRLMMKDPKKVEQGKRLAEFNHRRIEELAQAVKSEEMAQAAKAQDSETNLSYSIGAVIAVRVLGLLGYYIYQSKKRDNNGVKMTPVKFVEGQA